MLAFIVSHRIPWVLWRAKVKDANASIKALWGRRS
jgi:hypothetical protein